MSIEMLTAIGGFFVGVAAVLSAILLNRKTQALVEYRLGKVERKLDIHNGYSQKFAETTESLASIKTDIAVIKTKIEYMTKEANE